MDNNYPIVLKGSNDITYGIINSFINTKKDMVMVDMQLVLKAIRSSSSTWISNDTAVKKVKVSLCSSVSLYMGIQSDFII